MKYQSRFPIGKLAIALLRKSGLSLPEFVLQLGYKNPHKGTKEFQFLLKQGLCEARFREGLARVATSKVSLDLAWRKTDEMRHSDDERELYELEASERATFRPYLLPLYQCVAFPEGAVARRTRSKPSGLIHLSSEVSNLSEKEQVALVSEAVRSHYQEHSEITSRGQKIVAYAFYCSYQKANEADPLYFSTKGELVENGDGPPDLPEIEITLDELTLKRIEIEEGCES